MVQKTALLGVCEGWEEGSLNYGCGHGNGKYTIALKGDISEAEESRAVSEALPSKLASQKSVCWFCSRVQAEGAAWPGGHLGPLVAVRVWSGHLLHQVVTPPVSGPEETGGKWAAVRSPDSWVPSLL